MKNIYKPGEKDFIKKMLNFTYDPKLASLYHTIYLNRYKRNQEEVAKKRAALFEQIKNELSVEERIIYTRKNFCLSK